MRFCDFDSVKDFAAALQHQDLQIVVDFMDFEDQMKPEKVIRGGEGNRNLLRCKCFDRGESLNTSTLARQDPPTPEDIQALVGAML